MEDELKKEWAEALDTLLDLDPHKRKHFALLVVSLAKCYTQSDVCKAVILVSKEDALLTFVAGADEMEAAGIVHAAHEAMNVIVTADAPAKEMFN